MFVVGEHLLGAGNIAGAAFNLDGIRLQNDGDVQAVFQQTQILIAGAEECLDVGADLDIFFHSGRVLASDGPMSGRNRALAAWRAYAKQCDAWMRWCEGKGTTGLFAEAKNYHCR